MRGAALLILLSVFVPSLFFGQHHGGASSGGSGSTSSSSNSSSSGGSYHSSRSSSSSSSPSSSYSHSGSTASSGSYSHASSGNGSSHSSSGNTPSHVESNTPRTGSANSGSGGRSGSSVDSPAIVDVRGSQLDPTHLKLEVEQQNETKDNHALPVETVRPKEPNRFVRFFLGKREKPVLTGEALPPRPCTGKHCPPPPKPCPEKTCRQPPPACGPGTVSNGRGGCIAPQKTPTCSSRPFDPECSQRIAQRFSNSSAHCGGLFKLWNDEQRRAASLWNMQQAACSADARSARCASVTNDSRQSKSRALNLRRRYEGCRSSETLSSWQLWP
jgi:hypothetical protein